MAYYWPIALIVISNVFYNVCSKSTPEAVNPFASLTVTYLIAAAVSAVLFFALNPGQDLLAQYRQMNWTSFVLGIAIVGLEAGFLYLYKAGWNISTGQLFSSALLAICLLAVGYFAYHEAISLRKLAGIAVCLCGLVLINKG